MAPPFSESKVPAIANKTLHDLPLAPFCLHLLLPSPCSFQSSNIASLLYLYLPRLTPALETLCKLFRLPGIPISSRYSLNPLLPISHLCLYLNCTVSLAPMVPFKFQNLPIPEDSQVCSHALISCLICWHLSIYYVYIYCSPAARRSALKDRILCLLTLV